MNRREMTEKAYALDSLKKVLSRTMTDIDNQEEDMTADDADFILGIEDTIERYDTTLRKLSEYD